MLKCWYSFVYKIKKDSYIYSTKNTIMQMICLNIEKKKIFRIVVAEKNMDIYYRYHDTYIYDSIFF